MIEDLLRALSGCLKEQLGEEYPLYFGRILQGVKKPGVLLMPPKVSRRVLSAGRVQREYEVILRVYPSGAEDWYLQQNHGELLLCCLDELRGEKLNYRGRMLSYELGEQYVTVNVCYEVIMPRSMENAVEQQFSKDTMLEFGFSLAEEA